MGLDRVTALMEPRVTCLLATFFWMAGGGESQQVSQRAHQEVEVLGGVETELPERTSLKAASTLVESSAEVSMNMMSFASGATWQKNRPKLSPGTVNNSHKIILFSGGTEQT